MPSWSPRCSTEMEFALPKLPQIMELSAKIRLHEAFVLRQPGGARADLRFITWPSRKFVNRRLDGIELSGGDISGVNFSGTSFDEASLNCSNLSRANFTECSIRRADLRGARLTGAIFDRANLEGADFRRATIAFFDKDGRWNSLGGQHQNAAVSFASCSLKGARLDNANLKDANFENAILTNASFAGASLGNACFDGAVLLGVKLAELRVDGDRLKNCVLDPGPEAWTKFPGLVARLEASELWVQSGGRRGQVANFHGEDVRLLAARMRNRKLTGINLTACLAVGVDMSGCELQGAIFDGADLRDSNFEGADIRGASFRGANLAHAKFVNAHSSPLLLNDGAVVETIYDGANLEGVSGLSRLRMPEAVELI